MLAQAGTDGVVLLPWARDRADGHARPVALERRGKRSEIARIRSMIPIATLTLLLPALFARPHLQNPAPAPPHPNAIAELVVPAGMDVSLLADSISFEQATGESSLSG